jgi:prefoldin subunit 5
MITSEAQIDTIATVNVLRAQIGKLSIKMVEMSGNITEFNNHVRNLDNTLKSYGETSPEMMMNLFSAYEAV